jgi:CRP-like cAMP-binding protein
MSLAEPVARSATVISVTRSTVFRIPHTTLQALLDTDPRALNQLLIAIVRVLSERLRRTNDMIGSVGNLADWLAGSLV